MALQGTTGFLKGLIVVDDVAYFGISPPMARQGRDAPNVACDLVAVDLLRKTQLFRHKVATRGLLNVISAPQLSHASTFVAQYTGASTSQPQAPGSGTVAAGGNANGGGVHAPTLQAQDTAGTNGGGARDGVGVLGRGGLDAEFGDAGAQWSPAWLSQALSEGDIAGAAGHQL